MDNHIPRHAEHYGLSFDASYDSVLAEIVALDEVRNQNFQDMLESGFARKILQILGNRGIVQHVGEKPLIVKDNWIYRTSGRGPNGEHSYDTDPTTPLAVCNFRQAIDWSKIHAVSVTVGRPNAQGQLWLADGIEAEEYDLVVTWFDRLVELKRSGVTPHLDSHLEHIHIPHTLGNAEHPYDPTKLRHHPVEYIELAA